MEIQEAINKKLQLEADILELINKFEEETGTIISYINFSRLENTEIGEQYSDFPILDLGVVL
jgi:hypothetical protein